MKFSPFESKRPDMNRIKEIVSVLAKYQFGNVLDDLGLRNKLFFTLNLHFRDPEEEFDSCVPERVRLVMEELGTSFVKLGQVLSTRPDLVGKDIAEELSKLQDEATPFDFTEVKRVVEQELNNPFEETFIEFKEVPVASASIGQVHEAILKNGERVAVKVQRPGIVDQINKDIIIMRYLAGMVDQRMPSLKYYNLPGIVDEFERAIKKELDYNQEANNAERFRASFEDDETVYAPAIYREFSTLRVLTMEYVEGVKLTEIIDSEIKFNARTIAERGAECYFKQIFINGFFHADPHPGNILVQNGNVLCFIDFGMMGNLDQDFRDNLAELFVFMVNYDVKGMINQLQYMNMISDSTDIESLKYDLMDLLDRYYGADMNQVGELMSEFSMPTLLIKHKIRVPRDFILLGRVMSMAEDLGQRLDPNFNGLHIAKKMVKRLIKDRLNPLRRLDNTTSALINLEHIYRDLPQSITRSLMRLEKGNFKMELEHKDLDKFTETLERITNRISMALLISSLIIGSSLVIMPNEALILQNFPYLGIVGFLVSFLIALALIISIIRMRKI
ncbi:MAG: ABC transporter [Methanobacterium sp.]|nr:MAG: ABC transporter [Methanobacterium sp.]